MARDVENAMTEDGWWPKRKDGLSPLCPMCDDLVEHCECWDNMAADDTEDDERESDGTRGNDNSVGR